MQFGLDTNITCYMLDPESPDHPGAFRLLQSLSAESTGAINPTVLHESYHTLVYGQNWTREDARKILADLVRHPFIEFFNQTRSISLTALRLAEKYELGGRDSLILANYLGNGVSEVYSHDSELASIGEIEWRGRTMKISDPIPGSRHK